MPSQSNDSNGSKVWETIFIGIRNTWPILVAIVVFTAKFSSDRASIIGSVESVNSNLSRIEKRLETIENSQNEARKELLNKIEDLEKSNSLLEYRLEKLEARNAN